MITALELENFKAFGKRSRVELAPITLIYGENSAGKSSILNALNLLKQTRMSRDQGSLLLPRAERGLVDLGSFHELLHDHDSARTLKIRIDLDAERSIPNKKAAILPIANAIEFGFHRRYDQQDVALSYLQVFSKIDGKEYSALKFEPHQMPATEQSNIGHAWTYALWRGNERMPPRDLKVASCVDITDDPVFWRSTYNSVHKHRNKLVEILGILSRQFFGKGEEAVQTALDKQAFGTAIEFFRSDFSLEQFIKRRRDAELGEIVILNGFLPVYNFARARPQYPETIANQYFGHANITALELFSGTDFLIEACNTIELELDRLFPLGPYRRAPKRLYIFTGTTPKDVGYSGDLLPDLLFRRSGLVKETNDWLDRLDIGYHIQIETVGTPSNDLFEVRLRDRRRSSASASIALPDVGFGISQLLPFVVQTLASEGQTITIEQPEVHVHPRLQADLADLLIAGIQPDRNHRFIVETHSEHLVLRLLRRIRETTDKTRAADQPALLPSHISVVYLDRGSEGAEIYHLRINDGGEFLDRWPRGFFEERAKELF